MKKQILSFFVFFAVILIGYAQHVQNKIILSDDLEIIPLSANAYLHISYHEDQLLVALPAMV